MSSVESGRALSLGGSPCSFSRKTLPVPLAESLVSLVGPLLTCPSPWGTGTSVPYHRGDPRERMEAK